jgi:hypothetical protein
VLPFMILAGVLLFSIYDKLYSDFTSRIWVGILLAGAIWYASRITPPESRKDVNRETPST